MWKKFDEWLDEIPHPIKNDPLWDFETYRRALFLADLAWRDCETLQEHKIGRYLTGQLLRSATSVPANIEEGFGRGFGKEYAYFLRVSLGSARECRGWYFRNRHALPAIAVDHRINLLTQLIQKLTNASNYQRNRKQNGGQTGKQQAPSP